jgi:hypothetical protein
MDEETSIKLEMLRKEMKAQRDIKSQITMFNAGRVPSSNDHVSENQEYYRDNFEYRHPGKIKNEDLIVKKGS